MSAGGGGAMAAALARLAREDAVGHLRRRDGEMARLGSEGEALKLDWVEAVPWLLTHPDALAEVEAEARALVARGVHHVIWAGMGGSVLTVRVLDALGYCDGPLTVHPLDSTDPAALNAIVHALAVAKGLVLPSSDLLAQPDLLRTLLGDVALIAVAMGMTSEEPISHLAWLGEALAAAHLPLPDHLRVMALPGSLLGAYAIAHDIPRTPLQLDGGSGTGGRMSAPGTRVFLLPIALWLATSSLTSRAVGEENWTLAGILRRAWATYDLDGAQADPSTHRFARLAAALSAASVDGAVRLAIAAPDAWDAVREWTEQLFEESLGKGGRGVVVFAERAMTSPPSLLSHEERGRSGAVWLRITGEDAAPDREDAPGVFTLREPLIASTDAGERLAGLVALVLGLQLTMALYGYLHGITFAGQPAVEDYKSRARALRDGAASVIPPLTAENSVTDGKLTALFAALFAGQVAATMDGGVHDVVGLTARAMAMLRTTPHALPSPMLPYLDLTINGEAPPDALAPLEAALRTLAVERLGVPYKLRRAPAAYHSTEQSEMDGPPWLVSLRALALRHEPSLLGAYPPTFLQAQAVATWQAMTDARRPCLLLLYDGDTAEMLAALAALLTEVAARVR